MHFSSNCQVSINIPLLISVCCFAAFGKSSKAINRYKQRKSNVFLYKVLSVVVLILLKQKSFLGYFYITRFLLS